MKIGDFIPHPHSSSSTLGQATKKVFYLETGISSAKIATSLAADAVLAFALYFFLNIPAEIIIVLFGVQVLLLAILSSIKYQKLREYETANLETDGAAFRQLIQTREKYSLIEAGFGTIASIITAASVLYFFHEELYQIAQNEIFAKLTVPPEFLGYVVMIYVVGWLVMFVEKYARYHLVGGLPKSSNYSEVNAAYFAMNEKLEVISGIPMFATFMMFFFLIGMPAFILLPFIIFAIVGFYLKVVSASRVQSVDLGLAAAVPDTQLSKMYHETILAAAFGAMRGASSLNKSMQMGPVGYGFLGTGKYKFPENTILATNKRLLMIEVPMPGSNNLVGNMNYTMHNILYNRENIRKNGEELLSQNFVSSLLKYAHNEAVYDKIKSLEFAGWAFYIKMLDGSELTYIVMDKGECDKLVPILKKYLGSRFEELSSQEYYKRAGINTKKAFGKFFGRF